LQILITGTVSASSDMIDYPRNGVYLWSSDLCKFSQRYYYVLETLQYRQRKTNRKCYVAYRMAPNTSDLSWV